MKKIITSVSFLLLSCFILNAQDTQEKKINYEKEMNSIEKKIVKTGTDQKVLKFVEKEKGLRKDINQRKNELLQADQKYNTLNEELGALEVEKETYLREKYEEYGIAYNALDEKKQMKISNKKKGKKKKNR